MEVKMKVKCSASITTAVLTCHISCGISCKGSAVYKECKRHIKAQMMSSAAIHLRFWTSQIRRHQGIPNYSSPKEVWF